MRRVVLVVGALFLAAATTSLVSARRSEDAAPDRRATADASGPPGIVLLCLDTLRADALALDSGRPVHLPRLEAFARDGVAFADAVAAAAWTGPSVTSLLTGLDPAHSGVLGLPERVGELPNGVATLPRRLADAGWDTAAVTSGGFIDPGIRVMQGFRETTVGLDQDPGAVIAGWARRRRADAPFFLFLHSLAAHDPYLDKEARAGRREPVVGFDGARARGIRTALLERPEALSDAEARFLVETAVRSSVTRSLLTGALGRDATDLAQGATARWLDDGAERDPLLSTLGERLRADYVEGLAHVDRLVGRILAALEAAHLPEGTALIVVADHGESFGEHGTLLHGRRLFDDVLRVPLIVRASRRLGAPRVVHGAAGLVDVAPTVLALAGLTPPAGLDGVSLLAAPREGADLPVRALRAFEERRRYDGDAVRVERLESIRTPRAKCIVRRDPATRRVLGAEVYDLRVDPSERVGIPLEQLDRPCEFGDEFAQALEAAGFAVPCLEARLYGEK